MCVLNAKRSVTPKLTEDLILSNNDNPLVAHDNNDDNGKYVWQINPWAINERKTLLFDVLSTRF